jgi:uncharacterized protein (TIGR03083 family)
MDEVSETTRSERLALVDLLATLSPQEWATPSLCTGWTVQDVAAHIAWAPVTGLGQAVVGMARSGFRINAFNADSARRWARRGPAAIIGQLRANAETGALPMGMPPLAGLTDAIVHGLDIRRPLHREHPIPPSAFGQLARFLISTRWPATLVMGGNPRRRIDGLRLVVDDLGWSHGDGPEVHGSPEAMMLVLAGRPVRPDEVSGPGAELLRARL